MEESHIIDVLDSIGLSRNEAIVYLDLIRTGKSSVNDVAKRTKIHRTNIYDILEKLVEKGFGKQVIENEKKFFYPIDPADLLEYIKDKEREARKIIPEIQKIQNIPSEDRRVTVSTGIGPVKNIIMGMLDIGEPIFTYGTPNEIIKILGGFLSDVHKKRNEKQITMKNILGIDAIKRVRELNKMDFTEARFLPSDLSSQMSINICGDKTIFILWEAPISAITIESQTVADSLRKLFNLIWEEAKIENI